MTATTSAAPLFVLFQNKTNLTIAYLLMSTVVESIRWEESARIDGGPVNRSWTMGTTESVAASPRMEGTVWQLVRVAGSEYSRQLPRETGLHGFPSLQVADRSDRFHNGQ